MTHTPHTPPQTENPEEFWENFYSDRDEIWSGKPNPLLVREVESLPPGTALDLGSGEGGDAIWLAQRGWRVTAADISSVALRRGAERAAAAGVADHIVWERHDLSRSLPEGSFDLVSAQFLHSPVAPPEERAVILRAAAALVAPGGVLLIVSHSGWPTWMDEPPHDYRFPTIPEIIESLALSGDAWRVALTDTVERDMPGPEGQPGHRADTVVRLQRIG